MGEEISLLTQTARMLVCFAVLWPTWSDGVLGCCCRWQQRHRWRHCCLRRWHETSRVTSQLHLQQSSQQN